MWELIPIVEPPIMEPSIVEPLPIEPPSCPVGG